ncbi:Ger(x)C family spore germination protein [Tumebacillus sp. ITR2]|uniref:Ger(X)C family spore germination protein n=1 Tax=Tumebacillus amylolyticus TaxID=2801339 RepID=A0ABS1J8L0_9BACL|nr:Ger(x)C family spore germination protein [Tumebacillus amylolyticus]MBL0386605.1 Ger(x)C family spore germination protein [Tumebacillus amylolyticus]
MKRKRLGLMTLLSVVLLTGCWDRREINDVGFAMATAMDRQSNGKFLFTVQVAVPTALSQSARGMSNQGTEPVMMVQAEGEDFTNLTWDLQKQMSRQLNTSHRRVLAVGEDMAKYGLQDLLDELSRSPANRLRTYLIVARGRQARDLLNITYPIEAYPSEAIREMEKMGLGTGSTLRDFFIEATQPGSQPVVTSYKLSDKKPRLFQTEGIAVFRDLKLVGFVEGDGVQGLLMLKDKFKQGTVTLKIPSGGEHFLTVQLKKVHPTAKVELQRGKPVVSYHIKAEGVVVHNTTRLDLMNPKYIEELNRALSDKIVLDIQDAIHQLQKYKSDGIASGTEIYRHYPDEWEKLKKNWPDVFAKQKFAVTVEAQVRQIGMLGPQLELPSSEVVR